MSDPKPWYLYLIECVDGSIYTGIAVDVAARYTAHKEGRGARYTRAHPPVRLLGYQQHADRSSASKAEYRIKQLSAAEKWLLAETLDQLNPQAKTAAIFSPENNGIVAPKQPSPP